MAFTMVHLNPGKTDRPPDISEGKRVLIGDECRILNTESPTLNACPSGRRVEVGVATGKKIPVDHHGTSHQTCLINRIQ